MPHHIMKTSFPRKVFWVLSISFSLFCYTFLSSHVQNVQHLYKKESVKIEQHEVNVLPDIKFVQMVFEELSKAINVNF